MRISGNTNVFVNNYKNVSTQKSSAPKSEFASALQEQYATPETKRAASMTAAIEALDKALEKVQENGPPKLSEAQLDWLRGRYTLSDMEIDPNVDIYVRADGGKTISLGAPIMSEAHGRLLDDLHGLGLLSERDMEILNAEFSSLMLPREDMRGGGAIVRHWDDWPFWERFFHVPNWTSDTVPNWTRDIVGFHRATAGKHLNAYEILVRENKPWNPLGQPHIPPNNEWFRESAEAHNRLADILAQIFE